MRSLGLVCRIRKAYKGNYKKATQALIFNKHEIAKPKCKNELWVTDITYIHTLQGWRYLSVVLDACSRRVIGYAFDQQMKTDLVMKALSQAREQRNLIEGKTIIHSDRGCQFTSHDWHRMLKQLCLIGSMSHTGNCYDNATMERFFGSLKDALIVDEAVVDANTMKANIDHWIGQI